MPEERCAVAIMAKASVAGTVKTRLVPPLTYEEAAELNTCCLRDVATNIVDAAKQAPIQGFAAYHPLGSEPFFDDVLPVGFKLLAPKEATIGRSLLHAAEGLFAAATARFVWSTPTARPCRPNSSSRRFSGCGKRAIASFSDRPRTAAIT